MNILKYAAIGLACGALAGCGGGGATGPGAGSEIVITVDPTNFTENLVQGLSAQLHVHAQAQQQPGTEITGTVYVFIIDDKGVFNPNMDITNFGTAFDATMTTDPGLSVGDHQGAILIEACRDTACRHVYGSASFTYDFDVASNTDLKTLSGLAGASDWQPLNGDPQRTAYVPVQLDASRFTTRWLYTEPAVDYAPQSSDISGQGGYTFNWTHAPTTDSTNGLLAVADGPYLITLKESDGHKLWSKNVDTDRSGDPASPTIANGRLYTSKGIYVSGLPGAELATYDEMTGAAGFHTTYDPNECGRCGTAPVTVVGSQAFLEPDSDGYGMSVMAFDAATGALNWDSSSSVSNARGFALDASDLYFVDGDNDGLVTLDQPTGTQQAAVASVVNDRLLSLDGAGGAITFGAGQLRHVDLGTQAVDWTTPSIPAYSYLMASAIGHGALYVGTTSVSYTGEVIAYSSSDGHQLWSWSPPSGDGATEVLSMIATKDLLFVSTDVRTYAIDLDTQAVVWDFPLGGGLALSPTGILYIQGASHVAAINLE